MKIGLCGTVSVGKTTLVNTLCNDYHFSNYHKATERSQYLKSLGIPLNTDSTLKGQFVFLAERSSELMQINLITDRTIWDVCAFTTLSKSMDESEKYHFEKAAMKLKNEYDLIIYVDPKGVEIENNGIRETDSDYRDQIDYQIKQLLERYPPNKLITVSGTTQERIDLILPHIY